MENGQNKDNNSASSSSSRSIFGNLWNKQKTNKIEPYPIPDDSTDSNHVANNCKQKLDVSFAKCSPKRYNAKKLNISNNYSNNNSSQNEINSSNISSDKLNRNLLLDSNKQSNNNSNYLTKERPINLRMKTKSSVNHNNNNYNNNNNNHMNNIINNNNDNNSSKTYNRFSHQFSLCCRADRRPSTPPVSVRYNSLPEVIVNPRDQMLLKFSENPVLLTEISECNSAPETPIIIQNSQSFNSHSSPSTNSVQSTRSDGQPKSIAMQACKSRLKLKLMPPGKTYPICNDEDENEKDQHMSSPDISTQTEILNPEIRRSVSHENIQIITRAPSGSSDLARQALMAAQVLTLIPTEKARERNYMANRITSTSLLGASELHRIIPTKEITIFIGTWNMNGQSPPKQMNDFVLPASVEHVPDLIAIGTQESCSERFEWEVTLQETLGPSHVLFHAASLGTLHLAIFLRRDLIWFCSVPEEASLSVRPGTAFRTKGAVGISFCLFGTSMLFVTSHLTAHQQKVKERVQDVKRIIHALDLPKNITIRHKNKDVTQNFDSVYWCGDLNFRLAEPREKLLKWIENTKFPLPLHLPHGMMHTDQLSSILSEGAAFKGFMEANITFPPTYKYDPGTQQFDTSSKQRAPAYTDRILFKYKSQSLIGLRRASVLPGAFLSNQHNSTPSIVCIAYDSVPSIISSDHKPVWALFKNQIKSGSDTIPLAAGLFLRDVYVEGMRRRLNNAYTGSSAVCSIQ